MMKRWKETETFPSSNTRMMMIQRSGSNLENMKRLFKMSWSQRGHDIYIIFTRTSTALDFSQFDVALTDRSCTVITPDMERHGWNFFLEVNAKEAQRIQNTDRLIIVVPKKDPTIFWRDIKKTMDSTEENDVIMSLAIDEPPPEKIRHQSKEVGETIKTNLPSTMVKECVEEVFQELTADIEHADHPQKLDRNKQPNRSTLYRHLTTAKNNWHELGSEVVVFTVYVPRLDPWGTNVSFAEDRIQISFRTADEKFHLEHGTSGDVTFKWNVKLYKKIIPSKCTHKVTLKLMEIRLYKKEPIKWDKLMSPKPSKDETKASDDSSNDGHLSSGDNLSISDENASSASHGLPNNTSSSSSVESNKSAWGKPSTSKTVKQGGLNPGFTGLDNVGNSCFMNSVLQALANTRELRDFFLDKLYKKDVNRNNPLGMGGKMAEEVAEIMRRLWKEAPTSFSPSNFRRLVGEREHRFVDFMQHDAQEFMAFLLDKLHEDLNRIKDKPCYEMPEVGDRDDRVVAEESWKLHTSRNDSFIVDLFHGMFKSRLYCPVCKNNSVKFDPFLFLSVPLPKATRVFRVIFFPRDFSKPPVKVSVNVSKNCGKATEVLHHISTLFHCSVESLRMFEVYKNRIHRFFVPGSSLDKIQSSDVIFVHETLSPEEAKEPVYEIAVLQQRTFPEMPPMCAYCKSSASSVKIKRCTKCLRIGYCNQECQRSDWPQHRKVCERTPDMVGLPFIASIRQSKATFSNLKSLIWQQATKWTSVQCFNSEESRTNIDPLFQIVAVNWNGSFKEDLPNLEDFGDELLDLSNYKLLCITWETDTRLPCFVKVATKTLDCAVTDKASSDSFDLYNCVRLFTAPEVLAPQEAWYCPTCKEHQQATKELSLWKLPDILIVQLKRFSFKNYLWRDKLDLFVDFPVNGLDLTPYCINQSETGPLIYDLFAVVNHYGGIFGGHYTTYVRLPNSEDTTQNSVGWRVCDDSNVMKVSAEHVVTKAAYVMFYRKRTIKDQSISKEVPRNLSGIVEEESRPNASPPVSDRGMPSEGGSFSLNPPQNSREESEEKDSAMQDSLYSDADCDGLDEKIASKIRLTQSDCHVAGPALPRDDVYSLSSPELDKPLSPFKHRIAVFDDSRNSHDISVGCITEEPLLKYDEIFPTDESVIDHDVMDESAPGPSRLIRKAAASTAEAATSNAVDDPPYTDMDAVD